MQVSVGTLGDPQKDSDTRGHQYGGGAIYESRRPQTRYTLTDVLIDCLFCLI